MASTQIIIITIFAFIFPTFGNKFFEKEFIVGDDKGWRPNFDYQAWALGKEFVIGDKLVFKYKEGFHNIFKVNQTAFEQCTNLPAKAALSTGNDVITLTSSGWKCYICGVSKHCEVGNQKLAITVLSQPSSLSVAHGLAASRYYGWMATAFVIVLIVII